MKIDTFMKGKPFHDYNYAQLKVHTWKKKPNNLLSNFLFLNFHLFVFS